MPLIKDAGLDKIATIIGCTLSQSKEILHKSIEGAMKTSNFAYGLRVNAIMKLSSVDTITGIEIEKTFQDVKAIETNLTYFLNPESEDLKELQQEALSQLSFQDEYFRSLNYIPYVLIALSLFKVWAVPLMSVIVPIIAWIIPYIFLKFLYKLPISTEQYTDIMKMLWSGTNVSFERMKSGEVKPVTPNMFTSRSIIQAIFMAFSFAQSLIQPIQNAYHLYKIDKNILENGEHVLRLRNLYYQSMARFRSLQIIFPFRKSLAILDDDPRRAIHLLIEQPERFRIALRDFAEMEVLWRFANSKIISMSKLIFKGDVPLIQGLNINDISLGESAVPSTISLTGNSHHAILTGPNGGGKSSFLRALLQCTLLTHAYGVAPADNFIIRKLSWISSGLSLQDTPGKLSMFESEVYFASNILKRRKSEGFGLVIYDELFHSTNPPDGTLTAKKFLEVMWDKPNVLSVTSTHVFEIVEAAPKSVQKICCEAILGKRDTIQFLYDVRPGICKVSSVKSIWNRFKLFPAVAGKSRPKKQSKEENKK
uniref:DNA mismatch repair proteins mutS family domain-containing protein n=1 Tax=viral metagenome TaxID=1070528 RepID=A0A6C0K3J5_9ZZZZ